MICDKDAVEKYICDKDAVEKYKRVNVVGAAVYDDERTQGCKFKVVPYSDPKEFLKLVQQTEMPSKEPKKYNYGRTIPTPSRIIYGDKAEVENTLKELIPCEDEDITFFRGTLGGYGDATHSFVFQTQKYPIYTGSTSDYGRMCELAKKHGGLEFKEGGYDFTSALAEKMKKDLPSIPHWNYGDSFRRFEYNGEYYYFQGYTLTLDPNFLKNKKAAERRQKYKKTSGQMPVSGMKNLFAMQAKLLGEEIHPEHGKWIGFSHYGSALVYDEIIELSIGIMQLLARLELKSADYKKYMQNEVVSYIPGLIKHKEKNRRDFGVALGKECKRLGLEVGPTDKEKE